MASDTQTIRGYAIRFDSRSVNLGGFVEVIKPEAVRRSLRERADIRMLVNHDSSLPLARTKAGTLRLTADRHGLAIEADVDPAISYAHDLVRAIERGDVSGMSFAFQAIEDDWYERDGELIREVLDMEVSEVSAVTFPAYASTSVSVSQRQQEQQGGLSLQLAHMKLKQALVA
jgi:HK97 family phage prohead protease